MRLVGAQQVLLVKPQEVASLVGNLLGLVGNLLGLVGDLLDICWIFVGHLLDTCGPLVGRSRKESERVRKE